MRGRRPASTSKGKTSFDPGQPGCCALVPSVRGDRGTYSSCPSLGLRSRSFHPAQVLVLSSTSRKASAVGDVVNLVSVDVQRLIDCFIYLNGLWMTIIWMAICFIYLWQVCPNSQTPGRGYPWLWAGTTSQYHPGLYDHCTSW